MTEEQLDFIRGVLYSTVGFLEGVYNLPTHLRQPIYTKAGRRTIRERAIRATGDADCLLIRVLDAIDIVEADQQ